MRLFQRTEKSENSVTDAGITWKRNDSFDITIVLFIMYYFYLFSLLFSAKF